MVALGPGVFLLYIHGCISMAEQAVCSLGIVWVNSPAHAERNGARDVQLWQAQGKILEHSLDGSIVALKIGSAHEQQHEFVATYAAQNMGQGGMRAYYLCEELQYSVTGLMSIGVIDCLEFI